MSLFRTYFTRSFSFLILLIYISQSTLKAGVFFYYLKNKDKIAESLCINKDKPKSCCKGSCQLSKWINKIDESTPSEKNQKATKIPEVLFSKFQESVNCISSNFNLILTCIIFKYSTDKYFVLSTGYYSDLVKPPTI